MVSFGSKSAFLFKKSDQNADHYNLQKYRQRLILFQYLHGTFVVKSYFDSIQLLSQNISVLIAFSVSIYPLLNENHFFEKFVHRSIL